MVLFQTTFSYFAKVLSVIEKLVDVIHDLCALQL
jgi:hypothetical protein